MWIEQNSQSQCKSSFGRVAVDLNTGNMESTCQLCRWRVQHRDNGGCTSSLCPKATQLFFPLCLSYLPRFYPSTRAQGECLQASQSVCEPFKSTLGFQQPSSSPRWLARILTDFHNQMFWRLLFPAFSLGWGAPSRARIPRSSVGISALRYPFHLSIATCGCGTSLFCISIPPTSFDVGSSCVFPAPVLELAISPRRSNLLFWEIGVETKIYVLCEFGALICMRTD